ncbi:MAG: hypothetical protein CMJ33_07890 [Phycisphaerae bacterium]|nr:hypothetical protein [Phycisphaerae bacterium]
MAHTVRVVADRSGAERLRNDEVVLTRQAREIAALTATVSALRSALAADHQSGPQETSLDGVVRPITGTENDLELTRIVASERGGMTARPEIRQYVLPTVYTNNGSLIDVFA